MSAEMKVAAMILFFGFAGEGVCMLENGRASRP